MSADLGLSGTASGPPLNLNYFGMIVLNAAKANPAVNYQTPPTLNTNLRSDTDLLLLVSLNSMGNAPDPEYFMDLVITFHEDEMGLNRPCITGYNYGSYEYKMCLNKIPILYKYRGGNANSDLDSPGIDANEVLLIHTSYPII
jgi:hypothetical protein